MLIALKCDLILRTPMGNLERRFSSILRFRDTGLLDCLAVSIQCILIFAALLRLKCV